MHLKADIVFYKCFAMPNELNEAEIPDNRNQNTKHPVFLERAEFTESSANALFLTAISAIQST